MNQHHVLNSKGLDIIARNRPLALSSRKTESSMVIGYGHIQENYHYQIIDRNTAKRLLREDCLCFENIVKRYVKVPLNNNQFSALVSLVESIGELAFSQSRMLNYINGQHWANAANEFAQYPKTESSYSENSWVYRRQEEKELFEKSNLENSLL